MSSFVAVASVADIPDSGKLLCEVGDRLVVVVRVGDEYFCLDDVCTHDGGPLGEGRLDGFEIACPRHGARFDVRNGWAKTMPATENTAAHEVRVEGDQILVRLRDDSSTSTPSAGTAASVTNSASVGGDSATSGGTVGATASGAANPSDASLGPVLAGGTESSHGTCQAAPLLPGTCDATTGCGGEAATEALTEDGVREELKRVVDPELFVNIVDLGLVYNVDLVPLEDGRTRVKIDMTMTSPMCPAGPQMIAQCKQVLGQKPSVENVEVRIVMDPPWSPEKMSEAARDQLGLF